jgi:hypothetical protein
MDQAEGDMLLNRIRAVRRLDIGEGLVFVYGYDDKRSGQIRVQKLRPAYSGFGQRQQEENSQKPAT